MNRRAFIALAGSAAVTAPLVRPPAARAQQPAMPMIGVLHSQTPGPYTEEVTDAFRRGLAEVGYVDGQNVRLELRWAESRYERLPALAAEFVDRHVALIAAASLPSALAAKKATSTIPVVFISGADPVKLGLVASLNRPGGNLTGVTQYFGLLGAKRMELLRELVPSPEMIAVLSNPANPNAETHLGEVVAGAQAIGQRVEVFNAGSEAAIDAAFANMVQRRASALLVADDPFFTDRREQLVGLSRRHAVPAIYYSRLFPTIGGLLAYGSSVSDNYRQAGVYAGRILRGEKPADLPVMQPTKFELVINLKTAKALGLNVPDRLIAVADEVIE